MRFLCAVIKRFSSLNALFILLPACVFVIVVYKSEIKLVSVYTGDSDYMRLGNGYRDRDYDYHKRIVDSFYEKRKKWQTSNLGSILFLNYTLESKTKTKEKRTFNVLIWKYWKWLVNRHVNSFSSTRSSDPLSDCSVNNCKFTGNDEDISSADAVVVHIQRGVFPSTKNRKPKQRWIFLSDESPLHAFSMAKSRPKLADLAYIFNWSMTYRSDADVPAPYGRTVPLQKPILSGVTEDTLPTLVPYWNDKQKNVLATILISNCAASKRMDYLHLLQEHLTVDVYGKCSSDHRGSCPGHFRADCELMSKYLFYLVFENSQCDEYLTEKSFYHAYGKGAIPVVMGPRVAVCEELLPPHSFLHVDNYNSVEHLAHDMLRISRDNVQLLSYHRWRNDFSVVNEHGYFGSKSHHLCRICEALNYNDDQDKVYDEERLRLFLDSALLCRK